MSTSDPAPASGPIRITRLVSGQTTESRSVARWRDAGEFFASRAQLCPPASGECCRRCTQDEPSVVLVHDTRGCAGGCSRGPSTCLTIFDNPHDDPLDL